MKKELFLLSLQELQLNRSFVTRRRQARLLRRLPKGATLEAIGQTFKQEVASTDSILFSSPFIPNVGQEQKVVGASFAKANLNNVSEPIAGNSGVFVIRTNKVGAVANPSFDAVQQQASMQEFQQRTFSDSRVILDILKKDVKIKDNRYKFF
jgi:peptidyl-prolyl cis-trans isomerase D